MDALKEAKQSLEQLYAETSKHAQYQTLPDVLAERLGIQFEVNEVWRGDRPRYPLIKGYVNEVPTKTVIDFGANTGYFSLSLAADIPESEVTACELNPTHAHIIKLLAEVGGYAPFHVTEQPVDLRHANAFGHFDVALHLNILHHAGHDYDKDDVPDRGAFMAYAQDYLKRFKATADRMVFQMGYNWGGNKELPIIGKEDQAGKVQFTVEMLNSAGWEIQGIGLAKRDGAEAPVVIERFKLKDIPEETKALNKWLSDRYGEYLWSEFYQRPIWLCRSIK